MPSIYALQYPTAFSKRMLQSPLPREMQVAHLSTVSLLPVKKIHNPKQTEIMVRLEREVLIKRMRCSESYPYTHTHTYRSNRVLFGICHACRSFRSFCCSLLNCFSLSFTFFLSISLSLYKDDYSGNTTVFNLYESIASS